MAARSLQHGRDTMASRLYKYAKELENHCTVCYVQGNSNTSHPFDFKCPSLSFGACYNCQHEALPKTPGHHFANKCPFQLQFHGSNNLFCYTCLFPCKVEGEIFHDGGWRGCKDPWLIDKVKPMCWLLFRKHPELLASIVPRSGMIDSAAYCKWLIGRRDVFYTNALFVFYWYMHEGRHSMMDERSGREKRRRT